LQAALALWLVERSFEVFHVFTFNRAGMLHGKPCIGQMNDRADALIFRSQILNVNSLTNDT